MKHSSILPSQLSYDAKGGIIIEQKTWNMRETFCFPGYGCPTEIAAVQIKPQWQAMQLEDSLRLMGIYHITAHVRFDFQDMEAFTDDEELITIDALDIQGDTGYFEYAVPLHVDLPKESDLKDLMVKDIRPSLTNQMCQLEWTVTSIFNEYEPIVEKDMLDSQHLSVQAFEQEKAIATIEESMHIEQPQAVAAASRQEKVTTVDQKAVMRESSSHIVVRESSSWHEVPSMIWDLTEEYTPLKVRVSNDVFQK
ncbi:valyl-tRNA synthetase [Lysinibacillus irui]|uniref:Valyl-tRNA synthetase n=2 Tax=Lysinibacillus irui TaxID=2998077 RepID=A0ABU5NLB9_9BACI|nr:MULTISPECIES: valyl-tRNA synthetase [Lysinibacillus]MEA0555122.1 valyl-tRNA synthetase [Lysinibacillus irui]MEA0976837.1 valyl-tRNA synthetase [Lysinibacillus irui]MEA1042991.1 valyl-tRNA synthetase [Lysinibacillus irui]